MSSRPLRLFVPCLTLGQVNRGIESFTQELFDALGTCSEVEVTLFKGGGPTGPNQYRLPYVNIPAGLNRAVSRIPHADLTWFQSLAFFLALRKYLRASPPDVILSSNGYLRSLLFRNRRVSRQEYRILFSNGGPIATPYLFCDFVQQVAPVFLENAVLFGYPPERQMVVPYGFHIPPTFTPLSPDERRRERESLGLPVGRPLLLSVGALNTSHKRMDYTVREVAALGQTPGFDRADTRPFLLLLGQEDAETPDVRALADSELGPENVSLRTVPAAEVGRYYAVADAFILSSLYEGFGRVFVEALSRGLLCFAHDYPVTRYVLGDHGKMANLREPGALTALLHDHLRPDESPSARTARHRDAYERFSWERLLPAYLELFRRTAETPIG